MNYLFVNARNQISYSTVIFHRVPSYNDMDMLNWQVETWLCIPYTDEGSINESYEFHVKEFKQNEWETVEEADECQRIIGQVSTNVINVMLIPKTN